MKKFTVSKEAQTILSILQKSGVSYQLEYTFPDLKGRRGVPFRYDFAILNHGQVIALIEYDSKLHFEKNNPLVKDYRHYRENDLRKNRYALAKQIPLYRISYWDLKDLKSYSDLFNPKYLVTSIWHNYRIAQEHGLL